MKKATMHLLLAVMLMICSTVAFGQARTVTGTVTDSTGSGLPGITVTVRGTKKATVSNEQGSFKIEVNSPNDVLEFSSVGYNAQRVTVGDKDAVNVSMKSQAGSMNEVVVTALGIRREQRKVGYATTTIDAKEILKTSPTNFASALYGKAPGVTINSNPGGATSAVSVQIRGINSINYQRQPLLVVDGVVVRNGDANNEGYWGGNQRINGNGLLDINPENIASLTVLKGAAASALYGSDANFGVIVITTKNGQGAHKGVGIDFNLSENIEQVSVVPDLQTEYGPGYDRATNASLYGADSAGWIHMNVNGQDVVRPAFRSYAQFGPKVDGRDVYWWDGQMRPYVAHSNIWKDFYRTGHSSIANVAINNATDKYSYRFSYTRNDYKGVQIGGKDQKNTFNLNTSLKITPKLTTDLVVSYINENVHNRPRQMDRITNNYGGFFSPIDYMDVYFDKYQTTKGYKYVPYNTPERDPNEALKYNIRAYDFMDFLWTQLQNSYNETTNRLIASGTVNYKITNDLNLRGRYGTDYTGYFLEEKDKSEYPIAFGPSGAYSTASNRYLFTYGDVLLSYNHQILNNLKLNASVGYQARKEDYRYNNVGTAGGLTTENWFSLKASANSPTPGNAYRSMQVKDGLFGIVGLDFHNYLFLEGTVRRERTSTLFPGNNTFYYPGVSAAFELNNAFTLPAFVSYSKLRAAWGIVGNPPAPYDANIVYNAGNVNGIPTLYPRTSYGNDKLKNEEKHELEFGWETKLFNNRFGFDVSYYNDKIVNQILNLSIPSTAGATSIIVNVGTLRNYGLEMSLNGTPVRSRNFTWDTRVNLSFNRNKVVALMPGLDRLTNTNIDNASLLVVSEIGQAAGDILGYKRRTDAKGNYIINSDGYYDINFDDQVKMGNIQPKGNGGFINNFYYKNFSLSVLVDFRWGGQVISPSLLYGTGAGLYTNSLAGRDAEHGGIAYYTDKNTGNNVKADPNATKGPNNEPIFHDGIILKGVTADGKQNEKILEAANYYENTFTWGSWPGSGSYSTYEGAVFNNDFIKLRELSLAYTFPVKLRSKMKMQNLTLSLYGRNLFYFYKTLPYLDPEEGVGTNFVNQAIVGGGTAATRSYGASLRMSF